MTTIRQANIHDLEALVPLVDGYRQFYAQASHPEGVRRFMRERFEKGDAHVLLAHDADDQAIGFVQIFPVPSTTDLAPRWILNDLFVTPEARRHGTGSALLRATHELARSHGVPKLLLRTQVENRTAQSRYEALGWQRDEAFHTYLLSV